MHGCMHSQLSLPDATHLICRSKLRLLHLQRRSASGRVSPPSLYSTNTVFFIGAMKAILNLPHSAICMCMRRSQTTLLKAPSGAASLQISARVDTVQQQCACKQADLTMLRLPHHSYGSAPPAEDTLWRQQSAKTAKSAAKPAIQAVSMRKKGQAASSEGSVSSTQTASDASAASRTEPSSRTDAG